MVHKRPSAFWPFLAVPAQVSRDDVRLTGLFTQQQLEILPRLGIRSYLSTDACMFRTGVADGCESYPPSKPGRLFLFVVSSPSKEQNQGTGRGKYTLARPRGPARVCVARQFHGARTIFEDGALWKWWHSPRVQVRNPTGQLGFAWMAACQKT